MATTTPNYSFQKPTVSGDSGVWGGYLNANWASIDSLLGGGTVITGIDINSGTIDGATIGANSASTGVFTTVTVDNITIDGQQITSTNTNGNIQLFANGTGYVELYGNTNPGAVRFNCENNSHGVTLKGPAHSANATYSLELPDADGSAGTFLTTDGSGKLSFAAVSLNSPTITGTVTADGLSLGDNDKATFGAGNDLEIYHDGSNNYVDGVSGAVFVRGSRIDLRGANNELMLVGNQNGSLTSYYDNSAKLTTTATGIDVTGTVTADESLGIGTSSPVAKLQVHNSGTGGADHSYAYFTTGDTGSASTDGLTVGYAASNVAVLINREDTPLSISTGNSNITFSTNASEAMRIDSSGNLLVGTTNANPTSSGVNDPGVDLSNTGGVRSTIASNPAATFNRKTNDGDIVLFRKDGTTVGSIGAQGGRLVIGSGDTGLRMAADVNNIVPWNTTTNLLSDAAIDLGGTTQRFKDLHLSGTANVANVKETVYALTGTALDAGNGGIQTKTLAANTTFTDSLASGESIVLQLEAGASYTVTWPTMTWVTSGGNTAPTLTAKDTLVFWKVSTTLYGAYTGSYV